MQCTHKALISIGLTTVLCAAACGGESDTGAPDACNPLGGTACMMPWPSAAYLAEADTVTGYRIDIPTEAMPINVDGRVIDPAPYNRYDGFAPSGVILAAFPGGVAADGLPPHTDPGASLAADSPIVVLNVDTGERLAFFAEIDMNTRHADQRALIIRPLERMAPASRYAVAIRDTVKGPDGAPLPRPEAFQAILDGQPLSHPLMDRVAPRYDDIFAALAAAGVSRDELVLAWDFVTASDEFLTSDLLAMRSQALPVIGARGDSLTFEAETEAANPARVHRFLVGTYDAPNFLTDGERDLSILRRDAAGVPEMDGMLPARFAAIVPECVTSAELPRPVMVFGHGLFGNGRDALDSGLLQRVAQDYCFVVVAGDFIGLTNRQFALAAAAANDGNRSRGITEKLGQAVINFIALERIARGPMAESEHFTYEGTPVIDPEQVYYFGASLGGIMGNVFMAYNPQVERGALGVPGGAWSLMFERSYAWSLLQTAIIGAYEDQYTYQMIAALLGLAFEPYDPITTASRVIADPLPDTPAKQIFMYEAIGDSLVTNLATEMVARTMGLPVIGPSLAIPYAFEEQMEAVPSALAIYDEGVPLPPSTNVPPDRDNGTHSGVNDSPAVLRQIERFFLEGEIVSECRIAGSLAPCDCTLGACN
jgi:hypothetical protein